MPRTAQRGSLEWVFFGSRLMFDCKREILFFGLKRQRLDAGIQPPLFH